ncbi:MAG: hypothetical protein HN341_12350, partial [Verrucomicrobia bacterium]|nr:hypothetical protein [Verrucomicrobiota bacterium]
MSKKSKQDLPDNWKATVKQQFVPPMRAKVSGRHEAIFRGRVEGYIAADDRPFLKFTLETTRHRIVFGIYPPSRDDMGLTVGHIKTLTPGKGVVEFSTRAAYKKPVYRTIEIEELSATERTANLLELSVSGISYSSKPKAKKKKTGDKKRGRPKHYTIADLKKNETAIKTNGGLICATTALYKVKPGAPNWDKHYKQVKDMHDDARKRGFGFYYPLNKKPS